MNKSPKGNPSEEVSRSPVSSRTNKSQLPAPVIGGPRKQKVPATQQTQKAQASSARQNSMGQKGTGKPLKVVPIPLATTQIALRRGNSSANRAGAVIIEKPKKQSKKKKKLHKLGMNPYLELLLDPFNARSAKIVDAQSYPSATFKVVCRVPMTINTKGVAGICFGNYLRLSGDPVGGLVPMRVLDAPQNYDFIIGQMTNAASDDALSALFGEQTGQTDAVKLAQWDAQDEGVPSLFNNVRLVAAGLSCHFSGTELESQGRIVVVSTPFQDYWEEQSTSSTYTVDLLNLPGAIQVPVNQLKGAIALYKPVDYSSYDYVDLDDTAFILDGSAQPMAQYMNNRPGVLTAVVTGGSSGASLIFTLVLHYEGIPRSSTLNLIDSEPSPNDPLELAQTMNVVQMTPSTYGDASAAINTSRAGGDHSVSIPHSTEQPKQGTTLEKVINGIGTVGNVVSKVAPLAMELLAMI